MAHDVLPCLFFRSEALEAAQFYVGVFPNSELIDTVPGAPGAPPVAVSFRIDGTLFLALNGNPDPHFSDSVSFILNCDTQSEIDSLWDRLTDGGVPMPGGWLADRFGVRWQIAPRRLPYWLGEGTAAQRRRAMEAMMTMTKFDIAAVEKAHRSGFEGEE